MYLRREDILTDYGDSQLDTFGHVSLENHRAVLKRRGITDVTLRDHLGITAETGGLADAPVKRSASEFADDVTVVFAKEVQELFPVVRDQRRRQFQAYFGGHTELRTLELSALNRHRMPCHTAARPAIPHICNKALATTIDD